VHLNVIPKVLTNVGYNNIFSPYATVTEADIPDPSEEAKSGRHRHEDEPEPKKYVDLFIEEIYRQDALNGVVVDVPAHLSYRKIAERYPGEPRRLTKGTTENEITDDFDAVEMIVCSEEGI